MPLLARQARTQIVALVAVMSVFSSSEAGSLTPNGNPVGGPASAKLPGDAVSSASHSSPTPGVTFLAKGESAWLLLLALNKQGFLTKNISFGSLSGTISLDAYFAWADTIPAYNRYGMKSDASAMEDYAGDLMELGYHPKAGSTDPTGDSVHWITVIYTNLASTFGKTYGVDAGNGFYEYIDDGWPGSARPPTNPFYDVGYPANSQGFIDYPNRTTFKGLVWEANTFLATGTLTGDPATSTLKIYDGVAWGFAAVPEPSSWSLLVIGWLVVFGVVKLGTRPVLTSDQEPCERHQPRRAYAA